MAEIVKNDYFPCGIEKCEHKFYREQLEKQLKDTIEKADFFKDKADQFAKVYSEKHSGEKDNIIQQNINFVHEIEILKKKIGRMEETQHDLKVERDQLRHLLTEERDRLEEIETQYEKDEKIKELDKKIKEFSVQKMKAETEIQRYNIVVLPKLAKMKEEEEKSINKLREEYNKLIDDIKEKKKEKKEKKKRFVFFRRV